MRKRHKYLSGMPDSQKEAINLLLSRSMDLLSRKGLKNVEDYNTFLDNAEDVLFTLSQLVTRTIDIEDGFLEIEEMLADLQFTETPAKLGYIIGYLRALHDSVED